MGKRALNDRYLHSLCMLGAVVLVMVVFLAIGLVNYAYAASPAISPTCNKMSTYGFTEGLVYCVQASIGTAVNQYVPIMQTKLKYYEGMALFVAVAAFGFKAMNSNLQEPVKEGAILAFRVLIGVFFYNEATSIYNDICGIPPSNNGIINQAIGWVTGLSPTNGGSGAGSGNNIFGNIVAANCQKDAPPTTYEGYQIWQAFDCMFTQILGSANPAKHPFAFMTSLLIIIAASIFSSTLGIIAAGLGISMFLGVLLFVCRALFLVLNAFICIGFMAIFAPLIAPLIFFDSQYLTTKFKQWLGIIISAIFQPVFVVGFLGLAIAVDDELIEGNIPGCTPPTAVGSSMANAPAQGWGQDGKGVCSFTALINAGCPGVSGGTAALQKCVLNDIEMNSVKTSETNAGSPEGQQNGGGFWNILTGNGNNKVMALNNTKTAVNNATQPMGVHAEEIAPPGNASIRNYFPLKQLLLTLLTFIFVNYAIKGLMEKIPEMAKNMTIQTGVNLMSQLQVPFEDSMNNFLSNANASMMKTAEGKGLLSGNLKGPQGVLEAVGQGMLAGARGTIK